MENEKDETAGFTVVSSDEPVAPQAQDGKKPEEQASSEASETAAGVETDQGKEDQGESEKQETAAGVDTTAEQPKKKNSAQKRISELVKKGSAAEQRAEKAEKELADLKGKKAEPESKPEPVEGDFADYDKYLDALDVYEKEQGGEGSEPAAKEKESEQGEEAVALTDSQKTAMAVIKEAIGSAETPEDFDAVALNPEVPITGEMLEALAECDDPSKVMYHLGNNKDLATQISEGSPAQQARAIARLDMPGAIKPEKPVKTTEAPDPIIPVHGSDAQEKPVGEMSYSEYEKHMNDKERKRVNSWS